MASRSADRFFGMWLKISLAASSSGKCKRIEQEAAKVPKNIFAKVFTTFLYNINSQFPSATCQKRIMDQMRK